MAGQEQPKQEVLITPTPIVQETKSVLDFPPLEHTAPELKKNCEEVLKKSDSKIDQIANLKEEQVTFENSAKALDDIYYEVDTTLNRAYLLSAVSPDESMRATAEEMKSKYEQWAIDTLSRSDLYRVLKICQTKFPTLQGEDKRLVDHMVRDFKRMGLDLPEELQIQVKALFKKLKEKEMAVDLNVRKGNQSVEELTEEESKGIPKEELAKLEKKEGKYLVHPGIYSDLEIIIKFAEKEEVRKRFSLASSSIAKDTNTPLIKEIIQIRDQLAHLLGYANWANYKTEPMMIKSGDNAYQFITDLSDKLKPRMDEEVEKLRQLKIKETGKSDVLLNQWDIPRYRLQYLKEKFNIDSEGLKKYFKLENSLAGMYRIYEKLFHIKIESIKAPYVWHKEVSAIRISDAVTNEKLGILYLDLFPRPQENKFGHFAMFPIRNGKRLSTGYYRRPIGALICNFPRGTGDTPSLLNLRNLQTLFHEFGHGLHALLTQANYSTFSGVGVTRDFVEAPSQLLENWTMDKDVLDTFAVNYQNPKEKIPTEILNKLKESDEAFIGIQFRQQFAFALMDLAIHRDIRAEQDFDPISFTNKILSERFLPYPEGSSFITTFGHLFHGYDANYYGYTWSKYLAIDMASQFEQSPKRFFDADLGLRLRKSIYEVGGSRDENDSVKEFLGREPSMDAFLKKVGLKK